MRITLNWKLVTAALVALLVAGCASQNTAPNASGARPHEGTAFEQTAKDPPFTAATHFAAGRLAEAQGDDKHAVEHYVAALKLDPKHKEVTYALALLYTRLKQYPNAITVWKQYVKINDNSADAYSNLGFCYQLSGQTGEAESTYQKGITRDPKNNACRVNYGLLLARAGHISEATIQFQAVLPVAEVHYNLAAVFERDGKNEEAKVEYQRALALDPHCLDASVRLAGLGQQ
jgi:tetratricopeptide (TPR) repeat protein